MPEREAKTAKVSVESLNLDQRRGSSNAFLSLEERARKETNGYEHQVGEDGRPIPVGPETLQKFDEAVKRYNENRTQAQAKIKAAPLGGVTASVIVLEPDDLEHGVVVNAAQALDDDQYYAMLESGTNVSLFRCILA